MNDYEECRIDDAWIAGYRDWSAIAIFGDELSALRASHERKFGFCVRVQLGKDIGEYV